MRHQLCVTTRQVRDRIIILFGSGYAGLGLLPYWLHMQKSFNHSNHLEGDIINREFIVPGSQSTTVFIPVDHSLDGMALSVGHLVKLLGPGLVRPRGDHGLDTSLSAPEADAWII